MRDLCDVFDVGLQRCEISSVGFGDYRVGVCWRCLKVETRDPLETCKTCREELIDG
jgi:hypothetical protein